MIFRNVEQYIYIWCICIYIYILYMYVYIYDIYVYVYIWCICIYIYIYIYVVKSWRQSQCVAHPSYHHKGQWKSSRIVSVRTYSRHVAAKPLCVCITRLLSTLCVMNKFLFQLMYLCSLPSACWALCWF